MSEGEEIFEIMAHIKPQMQEAQRMLSRINMKTKQNSK